MVCGHMIAIVMSEIKADNIMSKQLTKTDVNMHRHLISHRINFC